LGVVKYEVRRDVSGRQDDIVTTVFQPAALILSHVHIYKLSDGDSKNKGADQERICQHRLLA
jgi:hypothetical protein